MKRRLSRDTLGILGTRAAWSVMGIVSGVILARWLGPHDRGVLALVLLLPNTVVTFTKLGITQANVYYMNRERASIDAVASNSVILAVVSGLMASAFVWLIKDNLLANVLRDVPAWAIGLALVRVPLLLLDNYLYGVLQATGEFGLYNSRLLISETLRLIFVSVALIGLGYGLFAAVLIYTLIGFINIAFLVVAMRRTVHFSLRVNRELLKQQLSFGVKSYVQTVTSHLLLRVDVYFTSYFLGASSTAFYALALHFTEIVLEIPQAVGLVLYPRLASLSEQDVHRVTAQACRRTLLVTAPFALALAVLGPYVIVLWYGKPYAAAGAPLPWAALGVIAMSLYVIITRDFTSRGKQQINIVAGLLALVSNVSLDILLIPRIGIVGGAVATFVCYFLACVLLLIFFLMESRMSLLDVLFAKPDDFRYFWDMGKQLVTRGRQLAFAPVPPPYQGGDQGEVSPRRRSRSGP